MPRRPRSLRLAVCRAIERLLRIRRVKLSAWVTCKPMGDQDVFQPLKLIRAALRTFQQGCLMPFLAREDLRRLTGKYASARSTRHSIGSAFVTRSRPRASPRFACRVLTGRNDRRVIVTHAGTASMSNARLPRLRKKGKSFYSDTQRTPRDGVPLASDVASAMGKYRRLIAGQGTAGAVARMLSDYIVASLYFPAGRRVMSVESVRRKMR